MLRCVLSGLVLGNATPVVLVQGLQNILGEEFTSRTESR